MLVKANKEIHKKKRKKKPTKK